MEWLSQSLALFQKGGLVMYPLLLCSVIVVGIAVDRYRYFRTMDGETAKLYAELAAKLERGDAKGAMALCQVTGSVYSCILAEGLKRWDGGMASVEHSVEGAASLAVARMKARLGYLDTIVTLAPLLGLLGTVVGMIQSFSVMSIKSGQPHAITGGVGEALVATATGLCVAVLALVVHTWFSHWLDQIVTNIEEGCNLLLTGKYGGRRHETA
ncbi:MAG TPA: MotA/TolQ/ExbB proton channel family protein [Patescibacteria group bacterium]|nr:MotA/TolQ/ExbB proton channel family protein [Patescibacteria group bacterium]